MRLLGFAALLVLTLGGCAAGRGAQDLPPDDRYGHRFETQAPDGRPVATITGRDPDLDYFTYPVFFDSVHVRPGFFEPHLPVEAQRLAVEVLVKGALPDDCSDLDELRQRRFGHIIEVELLMRKPQETVCMRVRRPFRFYFELDGSYRAGHYTLRLNDRVIPFEIHPTRT